MKAVRVPSEATPGKRDIVFDFISHNPMVVGSNPTPASNWRFGGRALANFFFLQIHYSEVRKGESWDSPSASKSKVYSAFAPRADPQLSSISSTRYKCAALGGVYRVSGTRSRSTYRVWSCIDLFELTAVLRSTITAPTLMSNGFLLLVQECVEHGLLDIHFVRASVWIDEGIPGTVLELRVLFLQVVLGWVVAERHVACERTH